MNEGEDPLSKLATQVAANYEKFSRGPYGVKVALQKAKQADESSLEKILVGKSDLAWCAYYAANKAIKSGHGQAGNADLKVLFEYLSAQPTDRQRDFADQLASAMEIAAVNPSMLSAKRRRIIVETDAEAPVQPTAITRSTNARLIDAEDCVIEQGPEVVVDRDVYEGAPLDAAKELFHDQFWDSIERTQNKDQPGVLSADISMIFQQGDIREHFGCQMEIGIAKEKVEGLASQYFGVKLEIKDGVRLVCYPGGGKIEPNPSIKLRACQRDISGIFQGDLYEGAHTSPIYRREQTERRNRTDGVSMTISNQAREGAKITVFLGEWRASGIKKRFYGVLAHRAK